MRSHPEALLFEAREDFGNGAGTVIQHPLLVLPAAEAFGAGSDQDD